MSKQRGSVWGSLMSGLLGAVVGSLIAGLIGLSANREALELSDNQHEANIELAQKQQAQTILHAQKLKEVDLQRDAYVEFLMQWGDRTLCRNRLNPEHLAQRSAISVLRVLEPDESKQPLRSVSEYSNQHVEACDCYRLNKGRDNAQKKWTEINWTSAWDKITEVCYRNTILEVPKCSGFKMKMESVGATLIDPWREDQAISDPTRPDLSEARVYGDLVEQCFEEEFYASRTNVENEMRASLQNSLVLLPLPATEPN